MKKLKSLGSFEIEGLGRVYTVDMDKHIYPMDSVRLGEDVMIDGKEWKIVGIEQFAIHTSHPLKGFLVKEKDGIERTSDSGIGG